MDRNNNWIVGEAQCTGDYRGVFLQSALGHATNDKRMTEKFVAGNIGLSAIAMVGVMGLACAGSCGLLVPAVVALGMQTLLGASVVGLAGAAISKLFKNASESKESHLLDAVGKLKQGMAVDDVVEQIGSKFAAKLGGWRHAKQQSSEPTPKAPQGPR